jgi:hypothetical protein
MKEHSVITRLLEQLWEFKDDSKRASLKNWRRLFNAYHITPRRYLAVLWQGNGHFMVESESRAGQMHAVEIDDNGKLHCVCEDHEINKNPACKHIKLVQRLIDEDILHGVKTPIK